MKNIVNGSSGSAFAPRSSPRLRYQQQSLLQFVSGLNPASVNPLAKRNGFQVQKGVTLIELMVTVAVAIILLGIAVPSFQSVIRTNRIASLTNELVAALNLARSEAITRGTTVTLCRTDNPNTPINNIADPHTGPTCSTAAGTGWPNGWLLFVDDDRDGTVDDAELRLKVGQPRATAGAVVDGGGDTADTTDGNFDLRVSYLPSGVSQGSVGSDAAGTFVVCSPPDKQRRLVISNTGRIRIERPADAPCP